MGEVEMKRKYWVLLVICAWIIPVDQWTKYIVEQKLPLHRSVEVIPGFFHLTHVRNTGGAFGIFGGNKGGLGSLLFIGVSLIAIAIILILFFKMKKEEESLCLPFSLVLAGAIGNLIDRFRFGEVIDFLDFQIFSFHWPAFNIADSAICIGIGLLAYQLFIRDHKKLKSGS